MGFYDSTDWKKIRKIAVLNNINKHNGELICEYCGRAIVKDYDCIVHHKEPITDSNISDANITLNLDNLACVHARCHNEIHDKHFIPKMLRKVYLVYGAPKSGKTTFVRESKSQSDIVVDVNAIYDAMTLSDGRSTKLLSDIISVRDFVIDRIYTRAGQWRSAWVIGGYKYAGERERLAKRLSAELIHIDTPEDVCLERCQTDKEREIVRQYFH